VTASCRGPLQERLKSLTDIVWPEMARMVKEQIGEAAAQGNGDGSHHSTKRGAGCRVLCSARRPRAPGNLLLGQHRECFHAQTPSSLRGRAARWGFSLAHLRSRPSGHVPPVTSLRSAGPAAGQIYPKLPTLTERGRRFPFPTRLPDWFRRGAPAASRVSSCGQSFPSSWEMLVVARWAEGVGWPCPGDVPPPACPQRKHSLCLLLFPTGGSLAAERRLRVCREA